MRLRSLMCFSAAGLAVAAVAVPGAGAVPYTLGP
jgi:hypothetical protein